MNLLKKVVAAFLVIAYGEAADRADEYVRLSRTVISKCTELLSWDHPRGHCYSSGYDVT